MRVWRPILAAWLVGNTRLYTKRAVRGAATSRDSNSRARKGEASGWTARQLLPPARVRVHAPTHVRARSLARADARARTQALTCKLARAHARSCARACNCACMHHSPPAHTHIQLRVWHITRHCLAGTSTAAGIRLPAPRRPMVQPRDTVCVRARTVARKQRSCKEEVCR